MRFNELICTSPNVRLCDLIQLFLLGDDDKIYIDIVVDDTEFVNVRIISDVLEPFYERKVSHLEESEGSLMTIYLET